MKIDKEKHFQVFSDFKINFPEFCVLDTTRLDIPLDHLAAQTVGFTEGDPRWDISLIECKVAINSLQKLDYLDKSGKRIFYSIVEKLHAS